MSEEGIVTKIRPHLATFGGYVASKAPENLKPVKKVPTNGIIKLDANENPFGCSPRVKQALGNSQMFNIYPDASQAEMKRLLSEYTGAAPERIVASNGSDHLIDMVIRLFVGPGDEVINLVPTFDIFRFSTQMCNGKLVEVPRDEEYAVDVKAAKKAITKNTKMIILANPNNPTGTSTPREDVIELIETGIPFLSDEAYAEFNGESVTPLVEKYPNLMVLRTFSKWAGIAGLRIGYGVFPPEIAKYLMTLKLPYNVSVAASVALRESLADKEYLMKSVKAIVTERERLFTELSKLDWLKPFPSKANFIFCHVLKGKASEIQQELENRGILIRYFNIPLLENSLRISVGKPEDNDVLLQELKEIGETLIG
jgi:histidinol-phosphate aminotransferase